MGGQGHRGGLCGIWPAVCLVLIAAGVNVAAAGAAAKDRPGALDPTFGKGGVAIARSAAETAPSEFTDAAVASDGDLIVEMRREVIGEGRRREIEARTPSGALDPSFGKGGKLTVESGAGIVTLADGDILIGADKCGGALSSVIEVDARGNPVASFGKDGCGAPTKVGVNQIALDAKGRILLLGTATYCPPCGKDAIASAEAVVTRMLPDGSLDPSFGNGGVVGTHADDHLEEAEYLQASYQPEAMAATPDGGVLITKGGAVIALDEAGAIDSAYGEGGVATVPGHAGPIAVQSDGSAFVLSFEYGDKTMTVNKLTPGGADDPTFGTDGAAELPFESDGNVETDPIATAPGGGVYVGAGIFPGEECERPCEETPALTRFTATGQPDPGFGTAGVAAVSLPSARLPEPPTLRSLAVAADGSAFAVGADEGQDAYAAALMPAGAPLRSFGEGGVAVERHQRQALLEPTGLFRRPGGGFTVAAEKSNAPGLRAAFLVRFAADGKQRPFAGGAFATETLAHGIIVPDGAGRPVAWTGDARDRVLTAAGPVGRLIDKRYGEDGAARFPKGLQPEEVVPAPGGGAAVIGTVGHAMAVYRVGPKGRPVHRFGRDGLATVRFPQAAIGLAGLVEADGGVVLTGSVGARTGAARLLPDGRLDPSFGDGGRVSGLLGRGTYGQLIAPWRGGGMVIAADEEDFPRHAVGLIRLRADGSVDRSFGRAGVVHGGAEKPPLALLTEAGHVVVVTNPTFESGHRGEGVELRAWNADGSIDRHFGHDGVVFFDGGTERRRFNPAAAIQQPDGKIVVAGTIRTKKVGGGYSSIRTKAALVRFLLH
jgi:uncharacterized delta-60 repeat protein